MCIDGTLASTDKSQKGLLVPRAVNPAFHLVWNRQRALDLIGRDWDVLLADFRWKRKFARTAAVCVPSGEPVRWKHLRSGMACHLLKSGWTREEVDARLGHTPNSQALDRYISYLAIDRKQAKKKLFDSSLENIQNELEDAKRREKLAGDRIQRHSEENQELRVQVAETKRELQVLRMEFKEMTKVVRSRR